MLDEMLDVTFQILENVNTFIITLAPQICDCDWFLNQSDNEFSAIIRLGTILLAHAKWKVVWSA